MSFFYQIDSHCNLHKINDYELTFVCSTYLEGTGIAELSKALVDSIFRRNHPGFDPQWNHEGLV